MIRRLEVSSSVSLPYFLLQFRGDRSLALFYSLIGEADVSNLVQCKLLEVYRTRPTLNSYIHGSSTVWENNTFSVICHFIKLYGGTLKWASDVLNMWLMSQYIRK